MPEAVRDALRTHAELLAGKTDRAALARFFDRPLVILSAPRSGSTLLYETLVESSVLWSIGEESHVIFEAFPELHPARRGYASGRLTEREASPATCHQMLAAFRLLGRDSAGNLYDQLPLAERPPRIRLLEKTPRNALNLRFLRRLFPDAKYVFLFRDPRETIASIAEAWQIGLQTGRFVTFPNLPGWDRKHWCLLLPPGWRALNGKSLIEIAAFQWAAANGALLDDLGRLPREHWMAVDFAALVTDAGRTIGQILELAGIAPDPRLRSKLAQPLPPSSTTVSRPSPEKWLRFSNEIDACAPIWQAVAKRLGDLNQA